MSAYYNEFDPKAAAWLRELINAGLIADGIVDERSISEVAPDDLRSFTQCHFFAGIGGWSYALRLAGWPDSRPVWTGSPPCQPFSVAGWQKGRNDERHLAPHWISLVAACCPKRVFGEQVASSAVLGKAAKRARSATAGEPEWAWFDDLSDRLEAACYAVGASDIPAAGVGAPHMRQRLFFGAAWVADSNRDGRGERWAREPAPRLYGAVGDGAAGGMANGRKPRLEGQRGDGDGGDEPGRIDPFQAGSAPQGGAAGGMGDSGRGGDERRRGPGEARGALGAAEEKAREREWRRDSARGDGAMGAVDSGARSGTDHGGWSDADWLFCRDERWRPVEPGAFPLADGVPGRMGLLRGYGNAIVPQAAALFIEAFEEAREITLSDQCGSHARGAGDLIDMMESERWLASTTAKQRDA